MSLFVHPVGCSFNRQQVKGKVDHVGLFCASFEMFFSLSKGIKWTFLSLLVHLMRCSFFLLFLIES